LEDLEGLGEDSDEEEEGQEETGETGDSGQPGGVRVKMELDDLDSLDSDEERGGAGGLDEKMKVEGDVPDFEKILSKISGTGPVYLSCGPQERRLRLVCVQGTHWPPSLSCGPRDASRSTWRWVSCRTIPSSAPPGHRSPA
jgi:hypothetical protein